MKAVPEPDRAPVATQTQVAPRVQGDRIVMLALGLITLTALILRLYRLNEIPPGLFLDEAGNGLDALDILAGRLTIFFQRSLGKEPLLNYLIVPFVAWLGREPLALRLPAALAGAAAVPATFLLVRELLWREDSQRATWAALWAAGLLAVSFWAITVNRISFRANTLPVVMALAFWLSWRTLRLGGRGQAALAGGLLGLCFYTYLASRFVYPLALTAIGILALSQEGRAQLRLRRRELSIMALVCLAVMLPLVLYFFTHWQDFFKRASMLVTVDLDSGRGTRLTMLRESIVGHLGMFGGPGDYEPRHNIPGRSGLSPGLAILFWIGVALALLSPIRRQPERWFALAWFFWLLLPSLLAIITSRHFLRTIGLLPILYFFPALALLDLQGWIARRWTPAVSRRFGRGLLLFGLVLVVIEGAMTTRDYFGRWANAPDTAMAFMINDFLVAQEINSAPAGVHYVLPLNDRWAELNNKYTLDFLVLRPEIVHLFFPRQPGASEHLSRQIQQAGAQELRIVRFSEGDDVSGDPADLASLLAGMMGQPLGNYSAHGYYVEIFRLDESPGQVALPPIDQPAALAFGQHGIAELVLEGWGGGAEAIVSAGGLGTAALRWRVVQTPGRLLSASLRLVDELGTIVGQGDHLLVDERIRYSDRWQAGERVTTYLPVLADPGTLPGRYRLVLILYQTEDNRRLALIDHSPPADEAILDMVAVALPRAAAPVYRPSIMLPEAWPLAPSVNLIGHEPLATDGLPGLPLDLILAVEQSPTLEKWGAGPAAASWRFVLGEREVESSSLTLPIGGPWRIAKRLALPEDLSPGDYPLRIGGLSDADWLDLASISLAERPQPQAPLTAEFANGALLEGWRIDAAEESMQVTLFWRASQPLDQAYTIFLHLLDEKGQIVAQHDSQPDNGRYPAPVWPLGVTVPDRHSLPVAAPEPGMALRAGLYLPASGQRVPLLTGEDAVLWSLEDVR